VHAATSVTLVIGCCSTVAPLLLSGVGPTMRCGPPSTLSIHSNPGRRESLEIRTVWPNGDLVCEPRLTAPTHQDHLGTSQIRRKGGRAMTVLVGGGPVVRGGTGALDAGDVGGEEVAGIRTS
jgi:hypothetical protein